MTGKNGMSHQTSKGRILRIKRGYNPNSSSLGSEFFAVFVVPAGLLAVTAGFGAVSGLIMSAFIKNEAVQRGSEHVSSPSNQEDTPSKKEPAS